MALAVVATTTIPTAGTRVQINNTARLCLAILFKARNGNSGSIYVGTSNVSSTNGFELRPNEKLSFDFGSKRVSCLMSDWYVDTATNGNNVDWAAEVKP